MHNGEWRRKGINPESKMSSVPDIAIPIQCQRCGLINPKSHEFCGGCTVSLSGYVQTKHEELLKALEQNGITEAVRLKQNQTNLHKEFIDVRCVLGHFPLTLSIM